MKKKTFATNERRTYDGIYRLKTSCFKRHAVSPSGGLLGLVRKRKRIKIPSTSPFFSVRQKLFAQTRCLVDTIVVGVLLLSIELTGEKFPPETRGVRPTETSFWQTRTTTIWLCTRFAYLHGTVLYVIFYVTRHPPIADEDQMNLVSGKRLRWKRKCDRREGGKRRKIVYFRVVFLLLLIIIVYLRNIGRGKYAVFHSLTEQRTM